jgi:hypothetical protein
VKNLLNIALWGHQEVLSMSRLWTTRVDRQWMMLQSIAPRCPRVSLFEEVEKA